MNEFTFTRIKGSFYSVSLAGKSVGTVKRFYIRHLLQEGWEATGTDGHRGVHTTRWRAAEALVVALGNGRYPFPIIRSAV